MLPDGDGLQLTRELKRRDPALEVLVITAYGSVRKAMEATKGAGAFHVLEKPFEPDELLGLLENALEHRKLLGENADLKRRLVDQVTDTEILGSAPGIQRVLETVAAVADADANVLIIGESGTGKELLANALHEQSHRRNGPWIKINCAALPKDLIESELFGHTRGAFTGATTEKVGLLSWSWPGNVRELQHAIERAVLVTRGPLIILEDLPEQLQHTSREGGVGPSAVAPSQVPAGSLEEIERASILKALETTRWNKQAAAALLGLRRPTLYSKMRKHGIPQRRA